MKTCNCRNCGRVFTVNKPMPFCSGACRLAHQHNQHSQHLKPTIQVGVINDKSNTGNTH